MTTVNINMKKSALQAKDSIDYKKIIHPMDGFLPCSYVESLEEIEFEYEIDELKEYHEILKEDLEKQYQFLINFALLKEAVDFYDFPVTEDNIFYDDNMLVHIKFRDVYGSEKCPDLDRYLYDYKCLVGGVISKKYSLQKLQKSGIDILHGNKRLKKIMNSQSVEEIVTILKEMKSTYMEEKKSTMVEVKKHSHVIWVAGAILMTILFLASGSLSVYANLIVIPNQKGVINGNQNYIARDYVGCIDSMKDLDVDGMDKSTKYILAVSYAESESFKKTEMETIVSRLSDTSNEKELEFWIYLGRLNYAKAQNLALSLSDDKLLIYAYMKELDMLESDTTIDGESKKEKIATLEGAIEELGNKYTTNE